MNCFLCIFVLATLPNVMAISCYICIPSSMINPCTSNLNVSDCDKMHCGRAPQGLKYDACAKASLEIALGNQRKSLPNAQMSCAVKAECGMLKQGYCNAFKSWEDQGVTVTKCDAECCYEDKCNGPESPNTGSIRVASVIGTFLSMMTIFEGVFIP